MPRRFGDTPNQVESCLIRWVRIPKSFDDTLLDEVVIVVLSLASVGLLVLEVAGDTSPAQGQLLERIDFGIALVFLAEFAISFLRAPDRRLFLRKRWWEIFACIPISSEFARAARGLMLLRLIRVMRLLRIARLAARVHLLFRASRSMLVDSSLLYISTATGVIVFSSALGFHYFEMDINQNVHGFWDSFWWAMTTVTTVGYGDIYPVTTGGRIVAIVLMLTGIGTLGLYTAAIASWVLKQKE
jgi:voltage-gated potassium channel